ncbi:hypothetical protein P691DRAFT_369259 [Macrolepiota fuliginosa MF-IS2]|uniref:Uncharacterized protein n=1 Tax=Macrolepiota fuliginosa MF-IS2 TaxID=1400762 RepID=A0A9P6BZY1_9AGAR|nr:hypothetical protein P691DRAFT_369259 [Macrolepiota fuliginosa MF-IS2]
MHREPFICTITRVLQKSTTCFWLCLPVVHQTELDSCIFEYVIGRTARSCFFAEISVLKIGLRTRVPVTGRKLN